MTPLSSGIAEMWDAASLSVLVDGAAVTNWTGTCGSVAATTGGFGSCSYIASSGGPRALRINGGDVLATSGTNTANTAMTGAERTIIVVARNILDRPSGSALPVLARRAATTR